MRSAQPSPTLPLPLTGAFHVRREAGLLPPGVTKQLDATVGVTHWFGVPVGWFRIVPGGETRTATVARFLYRGWPVRDVVTPGDDGLWHGEGRVFGLRFCRFRLEPRA